MAFLVPRYPGWLRSQQPELLALLAGNLYPSIPSGRARLQRMIIYKFSFYVKYFFKDPNAESLSLKPSKVLRVQLPVLIPYFSVDIFYSCPV